MYTKKFVVGLTVAELRRTFIATATAMTDSIAYEVVVDTRFLILFWVNTLFCTNKAIPGITRQTLPW